MKWFKHDTNANMDDKLQEVLLDYGLEGYGLYWYCIELISNRVDKDNITFELKHDARIIARNTGSTVQKVEEMMRSFVRLGLFENSNGTITCLKLARRLDKSMTSNIEMRALIEQIKEKTPESHDSIMTLSAKPMQEKKRGEKIREEENIEEIDLLGIKPPKTVNCPHSEIVNLWHEVLPQCKQVRVWGDDRQKALTARWKELLKRGRITDKQSGLDYFRELFEFIGSSNNFLVTANWFGLDWLILPKNFAKVIEGTYIDDDKK